MTCAEWEIRIASEDENASAHVATCESCRGFAAELESNALAMRDDGDIEFAPARRPRHAPWWIYAAAAGFLLAILAYSALAMRERPVEPIALHLPDPPRAPGLSVSDKPAVTPRKAPPQQAVVIKIITDDPDVVILLVNSTGGF